MRTTGPCTVAVDDARIEIPGGVRYDIRPGDKAIYVGTLLLHRDEFNEVTKVVVIDEYTPAAAEFKKRFGPGTELRKAIPRPQTERRAAQWKRQGGGHDMIPPRWNTSTPLPPQQRPPADGPRGAPPPPLARGD